MTLLAFLLATLLCVNTGVSYSNPFGDPKSVVTIVVLIVLWVLYLVSGHGIALA